MPFLGWLPEVVLLRCEARKRLTWGPVALTTIVRGGEGDRVTAVKQAQTAARREGLRKEALEK